MKKFVVIYTISANDSLTEKEILERAIALNDIERKMFKGDCSLVKIEVKKKSK